MVIRISDLMKKNIFGLLVGPMSKLVETITELCIPIIMANIIDKGIYSRNAEYIIKEGISLIGLIIFGFSFSLICQYLAAKVSQKIGMELRSEMFRHINKFSFSNLDDFKPSSLITRITNDVNNIQTALAMSIRLGTRAPFLLLGSIVMAFIIDAKMSIIFLVSLALISACMYFNMKRSIELFNLVQSKLDKISLLIRENISGVRVIRAFSRQNYEFKKFKNTSDDFEKTYIKTFKISSLVSPCSFFIINISIICILWIGSFRVYQGTILQGKIVALINYMMQILLSLFLVANLSILFTKAITSYKRILDVLNVNTDKDIKNDFCKVRDISESAPFIEFKNVYFSYNNLPNDYDLEDINVKIYRNQTIGIIGGTGSGKTTFVNLLLKFYNYNKGSILIDGIELTNITSEFIRKNFSMVMQKAVLFSGTVKDNLVLGNRDAKESLINYALKVSKSDEFINNLPKKIHSIVERDGKNFSGGQRQRLNIARSIVSNPKVLILDDSFSALDANTDMQVRKEIRNIKNITSIIISQRISSIKDCDKILVFDDGKIVGEGTHDGLINNCRIYKEICDSQMDLSEVGMK